MPNRKITDIRSARAKKNTLVTFGIKAISVGVNLAFVPLLIDVLSSELYGVWITLTTFTTWLSFFDVGFGHGLRNNLSEALARGNEDLAKQLISTAYFSMSFLVIALLVVNFVFTPRVDWSRVLNAEEGINNELSVLIIWLLTFTSAQFLFKLINSIMYAFQLPAFAAFLATAGQILSFLAVLLLIHFHEDLSLLILGITISVSPLLVLILATIILFSKRYALYRPTFGSVKMDLIKPVLLLGSKFFSIQLTAMLLFQSNNLIIAHVAGMESVTEFNIGYKYLGLINMAFTIITMPFWSATTDAYSKREFDWIKNKIVLLEKYWIIMSSAGIVLVIISPYVYRAWLGNSFGVDYLMLTLFLVHYVFQLRWVLYGSLLNGIGKIKLQFYFTLIELIIHIPLAILLGMLLGTYGVLISMILVGIINSIWPPLQLRRILNSTATGIWNR